MDEPRTPSSGVAAGLPPSLPEVEEGSGRPISPPPTGRFPVRWAIAGGATVLVAGVAIGAWLLLGQARSESAAGAWLPADTVGYLEVSADLTAGQRERMLGLLKRLPGFEDQARLGDKIDETLDRVLAQEGIDYRSDVKSWLGDRAALAFREPLGGGASTSPAVVILVASTDDGAAESFVETLARRATSGGSGGTAVTESYRDVAVTTLRRGGDPDSVPRSWPAAEEALAVVDGRLVAGDPSLVRSVIDVRRAGGAPLDSNDSFRGAIADLPADRLAALWVDAEALAAAALRDAGAFGPTRETLSLLHFEPGSALVGFARAEEDGVLMELRGRGAITGAALLNPSPGAGEARASRLAGWAPATTAVFVDLHDLGASIRAALAAARLSDPAAAETLRQADEALAALGTSADELAGALGDAALIVTLDTQPQAAVVVEMTDPALASRLVSQVDVLVELGGLGHVTTRDHDGTVLHRVETTSVTLPTGNGALVYALAGDALIVGLGEEIVVSAIDARAGGGTLSIDPDFTALTERVGAENSGAFYVDIEQLIGALVGPDLDAQTRAFLRPLRAAGWAFRPAGEDEWLGTSRFFLLVR